MSDWDVLTPTTLSEFATALAETHARPLAGGTDLIPRLHRAPVTEAVALIDMSRLQELSFIRSENGQIEIGALTTHQMISSFPLLLRSAPALSKACASIGSAQTRARGTLGGNLANASPAADTATPLLCLEAQVVLAGPNCQRLVPLPDFFKGPGRTALAAGEYIHSVRFPLPVGSWGSDFFKLGLRNGMAVAVASAAAALFLDADGRITQARTALGSAAAIPTRSPHAEARLLGAKPSADLFAEAAQAMQNDIDPISDIRASREYRLHCAQVLLQRALTSAWQQAEGKAA
jgi:Aerobic-type carbon monoxide dehydrogenase, middle subunit CoxM/CutM homologs